MQKLMHQFLFIFLAIFCLVNSTGAFAKAVLSIVPASLTVNLSPTGTVSIAYTVTNDTKHPINQLIINPAYKTTGKAVGISLQSNTCTSLTLAPNASCTFQILLNGIHQPSRFILRPRVCGYNGAVCSVPIENNEVQVIVSPVPTVTNVSPSGNVSATTSEIILTFSEAMNPSTISSSTVSLVRGTTTTNVISSCTPSSGNTVFSCTLNANLISNKTYHLTISTGAKSTFGASLAAPYTASFATLARFVYVTNYSSNMLAACPINLDGTLGTCTFSNPSSTFNGPDNLAVNATGTFIYVANYNNNTVSICGLNADGSVGTSCTASSDPTFNGPSGIAINSANTWAYVVNYNTSTASVCAINPNGTLAPCNAAVNPDGTFNVPNSVVLHNSEELAYVTNSHGESVSTCTINSNGTLNSCTASDPEGTFAGPAGFAFNSTDTYGYVVNGRSGSESVSLCSIGANGLLVACTNLYSPTFIGTNFGKIALNNRISFAYVANQFHNWIAMCPVNTDGTFSTCSEFSNPDGTAFNGPQGVFVH